MIRFIIQIHERDENSGLEYKDFRTLDMELPELQSLLLRGGPGERGFELWSLLGVEIIHLSESTSCES